MGVAYSQDLRDRVMAAVDGGLGVYSAAPLFRVSVSYIYKALGRRRATGDVTAHKSGGGRKPKLAAYNEALRARVAQAISSSWTTSAATRSRASERRSRTPAPVCSTCLPTVPISTRSSRGSPSSKPSCAKPRREPSTP
jgi:hypothetical protein